VGIFACGGLHAGGIHSMKDETLAFTPEENALKNTAKPLVSSGQLSVGFGTGLTDWNHATTDRT
jgi:hypothetical protein